MSATAEISVPKNAGGAAAKRNPGWDFAKGALVMCMVLYHSLNYMRSDKGGHYLMYLRFLPPSFIFITGFLITHIYLAKYRENDPRLHQRLFVRGLKLLAVFTVLNLLVSFFVRQNFNGMRFGIQGFLENLPAIYITGAGRRGIFLVLAPIAYLLMFSGALMRLGKIWRWLLPVLCLGAAIGDFMLYEADYEAPNLGFMAFGFMGMIFGLAKADLVDGAARHWILFTLLCAGYMAFLGWQGDDLWLEYVGVCVMVAFFYSIGRLFADKSAPARTLVLLGSYSLLSYITQIVILQVLRQVFMKVHWRTKVSTSGFIIASVGMVCVIKLTDWSRKKWPAVDNAYRWVFA